MSSMIEIKKININMTIFTCIPHKYNVCADWEKIKTICTQILADFIYMNYLSLHALGIKDFELFSLR